MFSKLFRKSLSTHASTIEEDITSINIKPWDQVIDRRDYEGDRRKNLDRRNHSARTYLGDPKRQTIDRRVSVVDNRKNSKH